MFKDKLINSIEEVKSTHERTLSGRVLSTNSLSNSCEVEFVDHTGRRVKNNNVRVKTLGKGFIGWFPKKGDLVELKLMNGIYQIESMSSSGFSSYKAESKLKADIVPNRNIDSINGFIL